MGCALPKRTTKKEWAEWKASQSLGSLEQTPADEAKEKESCEQPKPQKCPGQKFPGWAGILVGIPIGLVFAVLGIWMVPDEPKTKAGNEAIQRGIPDDDVGAAAAGRARPVKTREAAETGSLPPYEEVEK